MKTLSKIVLMLMTLGTIALASCKKDDPDPCENVTCSNGGTCNNGSCSCASGYEGATCATEVRSKFIGSYNVSESCTSGNYNYTFTITSSSTGVLNVVMNNFAGITANFSATVNGSSLTIPNQTVSVSGNAVTISGTGQLSGSILTVSYNLSFNGTTDPCTAICTKQ